MNIPSFLIGLIVITSVFQACSPKFTQNLIMDFSKEEAYEFVYFSNGHLDQEGYQFKTTEKDGRKAAEVIRASDGQAWTGMYTYLNIPIYLSDGKRFAIDVWMDHLGSFTLKLEDSPNGGLNTSLTVKNTKINQWETLVFDFEEAIKNSPSYSKIAVFFDIHTPTTGEDVYNYFSKFHQIPSDAKGNIYGDKNEAITIVVLGDQTAVGIGTSDVRNGWVSRYRRKLQSTNGHHQLINLAVEGMTSDQLLPTRIKNKRTGGKPDTKHNITKALSFNPDAIIINLTINDWMNNRSVQQQMDNYNLICQLANERGIPVWASTPFGYNIDKTTYQKQIILRDSINSRFGRNTIDLWRDLTHWSGFIAEKYNSGDSLHFNDEGHRFIFEEVWRKDILGQIENTKKGIIGRDSAYTTPLYREGFVLLWQEEFEGTELDMNTWTHELGDGCPELCGWGNNEKVWYRPENTQVKDGKLIITAKPDHENEGFWSASRIITDKKVDFRLGRIDIRAKLPETKGLWPALWLLGTNRTTKGWPYCGEIDMMEEVGHAPYRVRGTLHYKHQEGWHTYTGEKYELKYNNFSDDFHVYSMDWTEHGIQFFVDDQLYFDKPYSDLHLDETDNPFLKPFYMIINLAVGGNLPGYPDATSIFPQTLEVDYIRYFQANKRLYCPKEEQKPLDLPKKENLWIYLMAGQSNMEGQGIVGPMDTLPNERLLTMNRQGEWILAKEPLHFSNTSHIGLTCGYSFGQSLLECVPDSITIALVPCAVGGSSVDHWLTDSIYRNIRLWTNMEMKINNCIADGTFKGMIWHQGETDTKEDRLPFYKDKLSELFTRISVATNNPDLLIVTGELGAFESHRPNWIALNNIIKEISQASDKRATIITSDLDDNGDQVHFNTEALRMMGKRYALKMAEMQGFGVNEAVRELRKETTIKSGD